MHVKRIETHRMVAGGETETLFLDIEGLLSIEIHLDCMPPASVKISGREGARWLDIRTINANLKVLPCAHNAIAIEAPSPYG